MNLPKPKLTNESALDLWCNEHSEYAKEQMVLCNQGIIGSVMKKIGCDPQDEDLFEIGVLGLIKAINYFDKAKGLAFSTLAYRCVSNEILMTFRKKKLPISFSLDDNANISNGEEVSYAEIISDDKKFEEEVISNEFVSEFVEFLSDREKIVISLYLDGTTKQEIAEILNTSRTSVSRVFGKCLQKYKSGFMD